MHTFFFLGRDTIDDWSSLLDERPTKHHIIVNELSPGISLKIFF
jgi:hypothetical protein